VLSQVLVLNVLVAASKYVVGWSVGSLTLVADAVHSSLDASSNVVGLLGVWAASRPPDAGHPYGHRRFETIAAAVIGVFIAAGFVQVAREVLKALSGERAAPEPGWGAAAVVCATIAVNFTISAYERRRGEALDSAILLADSRHTMTDSVAATVVLASFGAQVVGLPHSDVAGAIVVSSFIAYTAWLVLGGAVGVLVDSAQVDPEAVRRVALSVPGVLEAHRIRSRGTLDFVHLDLHIHLDGGSSLVAAHEKTHEVSDALKRAFPRVRDVVIHTEPAPDPSRSNA
jgi:cation diffusion facilitator family transporter